MKIEPFKMRVTPEQSRHVQEIIFENGGEWRGGQTTVINTNYPCLAFDLRGDGSGISGWSNPFAGSPTFSDAEVPEIMYYQFINKYVKQKRTFKIPENTREISVNETDGRIVIEFVPEFKRGDIVFEDGRVMIIKSYPNHYYAHTYPKTGGLVIDGEYGLPFTDPTFRLATPAEAQQLFDALAKDGKRWNPETLKIEELPERERIRAFLYQRGWEGASEDSISDIEAYIKHREAQQ